MTVLDYVPHLDEVGAVSDDVKAEVHAAIVRAAEEDLETATTSVASSERVHPAVAARFPEIQGTTSSLPVSSTGMGAEPVAKRYSSLESDEKYTQDQKLKLLASYTMLRARKLDLWTRCEAQVENEWIVAIGQWRAANEAAEREIGARRQALAELAEERKQRCLEFKPVYEFLEGRWREKVEELVDVGEEVAARELARY